MSKNLRRLTLLLAAIFVMIVMAVPAFADTGNGYYVVSERTIPTYSTTDTIKVKVVVQSRGYSSANTASIGKIVNVSLTGSTSYTVRDVMLKFNTLYSSIGVKACDNNGNDMASSATLVHAFSNSTGLYKYLFFADIGNGEGIIPVDGWMFRVNGQNTLLSLTGYNGGPEGSYIHQTPVADGDVITFYFNLPFTISNTDFSTKFVAADTTYSSGSLTTQLKYSRDNHYNSSGQWETVPYSNYSPGSAVTATLYNSSLSSLGTFTISSSGSGSMNINLSPGTYYIYVPSVRTWKTITGYDSFSGTTTTSCRCLNSTFVFDRIVVQ